MIFAVCTDEFLGQEHVQVATNGYPTDGEGLLDALWRGYALLPQVCEDAARSRREEEGSTHLRQWFVCGDEDTQGTDSPRLNEAPRFKFGYVVMDSPPGKIGLSAEEALVSARVGLYDAENLNAVSIHVSAKERNDGGAVHVLG